MGPDPVFVFIWKIKIKKIQIKIELEKQTKLFWKQIQKLFIIAAYDMEVNNGVQGPIVNWAVGLKTWI